MRHYESVFILNPALSEDQVKAAIKKYEKFLKDNGCKIIDVENWGLKKLAYPIQKKSTGFYFLIEFQGQGDAVKNFELELKRDERVMRFLTMKMDKDHLEYSVKRREKLSKTA